MENVQNKEWVLLRLDKPHGKEMLLLGGHTVRAKDLTKKGGHKVVYDSLRARSKIARKGPGTCDRNGEPGREGKC